MKRAVRTLVLVVGVVCSCLALAAPINNPISTKVFTGPMPLCGPEFPPPRCNPR
jgi:hypothetical protein